MSAPPERLSLGAKFAALFRVGVASAVAYRGEFFIWILTTNMPLVMIAFWSRVAAEGAVGRFNARGFAAYFLGVLLVRFLSGSWVVWELTFEIRQGALSSRLIRPLHPFLHHAVANLAQIPLRLVVCAPIAVVFALIVGRAGVSHDPVQWALLPVCLFGAWALVFSAMLVVCSLSLYYDSALAVWDVWMATGYALSGYLVPFELLPPPLRTAAAVLPWRYTLGMPLETMLGLIDRGATLRGLGVQWAWIALFLTLSVTLWKRGLRRYESFGG